MPFILHLQLDVNVIFPFSKKWFDLATVRIVCPIFKLSRIDWGNFLASDFPSKDLRLDFYRFEFWLGLGSKDRKTALAQKSLVE